MNDAARARLYSLLEGSNTFKAGQQSERDRLRLLIDIRIDQLRGPPHRPPPQTVELEGAGVERT
jgi:hypothetical protein